jgi:hypothetical protein
MILLVVATEVAWEMLPDLGTVVQSWALGDRVIWTVLSEMEVLDFSGSALLPEIIVRGAYYSVLFCKSREEAS